MEGKNRPDEIEAVLVQMESHHIPDVVRIENDSFSTPWSATIFMRAIRDEKTHALVALLEREVVGYAIFWIVGDYAEVSDVAVDRRWRKRGIGDMLLTTVIETCAVLGVGSLFLEVRESNGPARRLYERKNFTEISRRERYYTKPVEDAIVYGLEVQAGKDRGGPSG